MAVCDCDRQGISYTSNLKARVVVWMMIDDHMDDVPLGRLSPRWAGGRGKEGVDEGMR